MQKVILKIGGMSCSACSSSLEKYLNKQEGVKASVNLVLGEASIEYEKNIKIADLERFVQEAGFESLGIYDPLKEEKEIIAKKRYNLISLLAIGFLTLIILYLSMGSMFKLPIPNFLNIEKYPFELAILLAVMTLIVLILSFDIIKNGFKNLIHKTPNMDTLVTFGILASYFYSLYSCLMIYLNHLEYIDRLYFESCSTVIFFLKLGRYIDNNSREKTKEALKELVQITPNKALLKSGDEEIEISIDEVKKNDILIAKPGMKIAVDGLIVKGESHLDESFLTGESVPTKKGEAQNVIAGSYNIDGYLLYKALKIGKDSTISEIVKLVVEATNSKVPLQKLADKVCGYFVPCIMLIAALTFFGYLILGYPFNIAISSFVTVLVVACPCALGLATPLAVVTSLGTSAKNGILIKNSETFENVSKVKTIVFDKTGTLTYGKLKIAKIINYSNYENKELLELVASLESKSNHPIALAFLNYAKENNLKIREVKNFENLDGIGVTGKIDNENIYLGNSKLFSKLKIKNNYNNDEKKLTNLGCSLVYVIINKEVKALIGVSDIVRDDSIKTIKDLKFLGKDVIMLTGDNEETAKIIGDSLGIKNIVANVLPSEKAKVIKELIKKEKTVMMVGDGINDAPSLVSATVGVSMNSGTDVALDSADVILMHDNLINVVNLIKISKRTLKNIQENLFWAFFYNILMIPIAIGFFKGLGISINPMLAGLAMTISSLTVVLNSLRLRKW